MGGYYDNLKNGDTVIVACSNRYGIYYKSHKLIKMSKSRRFTLDDDRVYLSDGNGYGHGDKIVDITNEKVKKEYDSYLVNEQSKRKLRAIQIKAQNLSNLVYQRQFSAEENELINEVYNLIGVTNEG